MSGVSAPPPTSSLPPLKKKSSRCRYPSTSVVPCLCPQHPRYSSNIGLKSITTLAGGFSRFRVRCRSSSSGPGGPGSGTIRGVGLFGFLNFSSYSKMFDVETMEVTVGVFWMLFVLGKALAEALNERIKSTVGELLSSVGRLQAEQQKQVQDFQEDVLERAKRAKEKAAREAMETQGLIPKSTRIEPSAATDDVPNEVSTPAVDDEDVLGRAKRAKEKAAREAMETQGLIPKSTRIEPSAATDDVPNEVSTPAVDDVSSNFTLIFQSNHQQQSYKHRPSPRDLKR
ncbi:hypothetical protein HHK36_020368 [Tetracentron sinense]|uniref:Uncharacterized protein n=1 Tax=Tetracentron sinense TaxID=13715 RepID=A0A834YZJ0_TETSI|nr:hypothetical protein HHK36_020368 [Tetracentron sinense]